MSNSHIHLDLEEFKKPQPKIADPAAKAAVEQVAKDSGFRTRHAPERPESEKAEPAKVLNAPSETSPEGEARRRGRKRTTNRNTPFTVKLKVETNNQIYDLADQLQCSAIAEVLELALGALQKEIDQGIDPRARASDQLDKI